MDIFTSRAKLDFLDQLMNIFNTVVIQLLCIIYPSQTHYTRRTCMVWFWARLSLPVRKQMKAAAAMTTELSIPHTISRREQLSCNRPAVWKNSVVC